MKIKFVDTSIEIKIPNQPKLEMQKDFVFNELELTQEIRSIPKFKLTLSFNDPEILKGVVELNFEYERVYKDEKGDEKSQKYKCTFGITEKYLKDKSVVYFGYTLPINSIRIKKTRYLSNSINTSIKTLAPDFQKYNLTNNISTNIFQVSCTDAEKLISLCMKNSETPWWYISLDTINTKNENKIQTNQDNMILGQNYDYTEITKNLFSEGDKSDKIKTKTFNEQKNFNVVSDNYKNVFITKYSSNQRYYLDNIENIYYSIKDTVETSFNSEYIFELGTKIKNELTKLMNNKYLMVSKIVNTYSFANMRVLSKVTLIGVDDN